MRPLKVPVYIQELLKFHGRSDIARAIYTHQKYLYKRIGEPEVSILIPAFNEEKTILKTLQSLCFNNTARIIEIIVVNNNSTDNTEAIAKSTGVRCINETVQGITAARNAALGAARGKYILNADADSIYPEDWIEEMIKPLAENEDISVTYGNFAMLPSSNQNRFNYYIYEQVADFSRYLNLKFKDEAVNVYGFNFAFRREQGLAVDWFSHPKDANEDGWMALKLRDKGFGKLHHVINPKALVWTSDRRIHNDGGLWNATKKRLKRFFMNEHENHPGLK